jgi:septation ring formation regulator EzrA
MSKLNKKTFKPEEVLKDINEILNVLEDFETSDIETLDINKFSQKIDKISEKIDKKYDGKNLDIKK